MESSLKDKDEELAVLVSQFDEFCDATDNMRAVARKCRDYKDGKQWTDEEIQTLNKRKQPVVTDNKIQDKVNTLMGLERLQRTDPKAFPRNPQDEGSAEAATDALRFVADQSDYQRSARKPAVDNLIVEGLCYGQVVVDNKNGSPKVALEHIRWDRGYYDPRSLRDDFADKRYAGYFTWMDIDAAKREFKGKDAELEATFGSSADDKEHEDKPTEIRYGVNERGRKRVQVFTTYYDKGGVWHYARWCKGGMLEDPQPSPYKNEFGQPDCAIEVQALFRDSDGNPYGWVLRDLDLQDEHNKRRSKMLHLLNSKRLITQKGAFDSINDARTELHKPDGVLQSNYPIEQVRVEDNLNAAEGQWRLMQQTADALSQTGPNAAIQGNTGSISGRAKQLDQQSGSLTLSPIFDALDAWEMRIYRQAWNRVRQFWTAPMWIRVTDDEKKLKFVGLNQPVTQGEQAAEQLKASGMPPEQIAATLQRIAADPAANEPVIEGGKFIKRNEVAQMDVDIIISRSEDTVNLQAEQFQILAGLAETRPEVPFTAVLKLSGLRSEIKNEVLDQISGQNDPNAQAVAQMQQVMGELEMRLKAAEGALKEAQAAKTEAETAKIQTETVASGIHAATSLVTAGEPQQVN